MSSQTTVLAPPSFSNDAKALEEPVISWKPPYKKDGTPDYDAPLAQWERIVRPVKSVSIRADKTAADPMLEKLRYHRLRRELRQDGFLVSRRKDGTIVNPPLRRFDLRDTRQRAEHDMRTIARRQQEQEAKDASIMSTVERVKRMVFGDSRTHRTPRTSFAKRSGRRDSVEVGTKMDME